MKYHIIIIAIATLIAGVNESHAQAVQNLPSDVSRVIAQRDAEIRKINRSCVIELERIKVAYTKRGDLKNAVLVDNLVKEMKAAHAANVIVGRWTFSRRGEDRIYEFRADGSVSGQYLTGGLPFVARWKAVGPFIEVYDTRGKTFIKVSIEFEGDVRLMVMAVRTKSGPGRKSTDLNT